MPGIGDKCCPHGFQLRIKAVGRTFKRPCRINRIFADIPAFISQQHHRRDARIVCVMVPCRHVFPPINLEMIFPARKPGHKVRPYCHPAVAILQWRRTRPLAPSPCSHNYSKRYRDLCSSPSVLKSVIPWSETTMTLARLSNCNRCKPSINRPMALSICGTAWAICDDSTP